MKFLEDIRDSHKDEEIWVVGSAPSMDNYPIDFFKNKICIGMNFVFSVFIDVGDGIEKFSTRRFYSVHQHRPSADWIAKHRPSFLKNCFFLLPPKCRHSSKSGYSMVWWEDYNEDPYYMRWGLKGELAVSATDQDFAEVAKCIAAQKGQCQYVCRGTSLHWAVQAAAVLGAKKIYVVGAEGGTKAMRKHGSMYTQFADYKYSHPHWLAGTRALAKAFEPYGIKVVSYYYSKGEQKL